VHDGIARIRRFERETRRLMGLLFTFLAHSQHPNRSGTLKHHAIPDNRCLTSTTATDAVYYLFYMAPMVPKYSLNVSRLQSISISAL
jgi:hypothetical protein